MTTLRPSAANSWSVCPGYIRMQRHDFDDWGDPVVREEGTACHEAAQCVAQGQAVPQIASNGVEIDADMMEAALDYVGRCREVMGEHMEVEQHVKCHGVHQLCEGTPDTSAFLPNSYEIWVADMKYGFRPVDVNTKQLVCYVDGVARRHNVDLSRAWVNIAVFQPRASHPDGPWCVRRVHGQQMLQEIADLSVAAHATQEPDAPCVVNAGCGDCTGRFQCEALRNSALSAVERVGRSIPVNMSLQDREAELRYVEHSAKLLEAYVSGLRMVVEHDLRGGARGAHYQIKQSAPGRLKWNEDAQEKVVRFAAMAGWDVMKPAELRTPSQLRKILGDGVIETHARRSPGAMTLAPIDINRYSKLLGKY